MSLGAYIAVWCGTSVLFAICWGRYQRTIKEPLREPMVITDEIADRIIRDIVVMEPLSVEEQAELDDFCVFEDLADDQSWIDAGVEWASCHATWLQCSDAEIEERRNRWAA